jgi:proteasome component ECM29
MATEQSPEAKELSLVGKVEMRIALADGDQKLQATLNIYLAPLLLKLASEYMSVRNKVCIHIVRMALSLDIRTRSEVWTII